LWLVLEHSAVKGKRSAMTKPPFITHSVHLKAFTPEQLLEAVRGAHLDHFILDRTRCDARLERWTSEDFTVDTGRYSFPVRVVGAFPKTRLCVGYMRALTECTWVNGFLADDSTMEFYPAGAELNYRAAPNGEWVAIEFEEAALQNAARKRLGHGVEVPWKHVMSFQVAHEQRAELDRMVRRLWRHPISGALMIGPILGAIAEMLFSLQRNGTAVLRQRRLHQQNVLRLADQYLQTHLASPFKLNTLASATGTTPRTLQRMFANAYGITPHEWARCRALHHVRERLEATDGRKFTVEGIAKECGFQHMGRFAEYYRGLFGELPSATLSA
jgi:AraC family transcriptional regulator, ethanolamine operon transcriptional activator